LNYPFDQTVTNLVQSSIFLERPVGEDKRGLSTRMTVFLGTAKSLDFTVESDGPFPTQSGTLESSLVNFTRSNLISN